MSEDNMSSKSKHIFVSIYWKAVCGLGVVFFALISMMTYFNAQQLTNLQMNHRASSQHQYVLEYKGLLKKTELQLINIIDSLSNLKSGSPSLQSKIQDNWFALQITWALESAVLLDSKGEIIQRWGNLRIKPDTQTSKRTLANGRPTQQMFCYEYCMLVVTAPILSERGDIQLIQLSVSIADTMIDFQRITGSDIGILTPSISGASDQYELGSSGMRLSGLTNRTILQPILNEFADEQAWTFNSVNTTAQNIFVLNLLNAQYELMLIPSADQENNSAIVMLISNTTSVRDQIQNARRTYILTGLIATVISLSLIILFIWRPIRSLQQQSKALLLLPKGSFLEAREMLNSMKNNRLFNDELSYLQATSLKVNSQLEDYHKRLTRNSKKLYDMAHFDPLTSLINRTYLSEIIDNKLSDDDLNEQNFVLIYLDLDNFKHINDALGHKVGDQLLVIIAQRLKAIVGPKDYAARTGGDEFCLVLSRTRKKDYAIEFARKILSIMEEPVVIDGRNLAVSTSIGIAVSSDSMKSAGIMLQNADLAMYEAKSAGKNKYHVFDRQLHKNADSRMALEEELRHAVANKEFVLHYQPQINLNTGELIGCEALIRWLHPERGMLAPFFFIDQIENNGLIIPVGKWIIQEACRQCDEWNRNGFEGIKMSINLSARQFSDPDLMQDIQAAIAAYDISPSQLEFEVTESLLASDIKHAIELLKALQSIGLTIAIDDFGTGYSSLSYLKQLPLDKLKVDRAFVMDIPDNNDDKLITTAIIAMAHSLNLKVVAEGVETTEQMAFLQSLGCEIGQGYLFNKPLSPQEFEQHPIIAGSYVPFSNI